MTVDTVERQARERGHHDEREELICRLLASGMSRKEISVILKIRVEEVSVIESNNAKTKIPDYAEKLKSRLKSNNMTLAKLQEEKS